MCKINPYKIKASFKKLLIKGSVAFSLAIFIGMIFSSVAFSISKDFLAYSQDVLNKALKVGLKKIPNKQELSLMQQKALGNDTAISKQHLQLGKTLFFDPRLSKDRLKSCNTCHNLSLAGSNYKGAWRDFKNKDLNPPSIYNSMFNDVLYYDGRINSFIESSSSLSPNLLALATINAFQSTIEMGNNLDDIVSIVKSSNEYSALFKKAYGLTTKITPELLAKSISMFLMSLNTSSRFDDFLDGNLKALTKEEILGLDVFIDKGCANCHMGINLGGSMQPFEIMDDFKYKNIGAKAPRNGVKAPTLRNITQSMPYFHNGVTLSLEESIKEMAKIQLQTSISSKEMEYLIAFFKSLNGAKPELIVPILPDIDIK